MADLHTDRAPTAERVASGRGPLESLDGPSLVDVLERVLDRGLVVEASARAALAELDVVGGEGVIAVASVEVAQADADGWDALVRQAESSDAAGAGLVRGRVLEAARERDELRRSGEHAALKRQFERLNA